MLSFRCLAFSNFEIPIVEGETIRELHLRIMRHIGYGEMYKDMAPIILTGGGKLFSSTELRHHLVKDEIDVTKPIYMQPSTLGSVNTRLLGNLRSDDHIPDTLCAICHEDLSHRPDSRYVVVHGCDVHCFHMICLASLPTDNCPVCRKEIGKVGMNLHRRSIATMTTRMEK